MVRAQKRTSVSVTVELERSKPQAGGRDRARDDSAVYKRRLLILSDLVVDDDVSVWRQNRWSEALLSRWPLDMALRRSGVAPRQAALSRRAVRGAWVQLVAARIGGKVRLRVVDSAQPVVVRRTCRAGLLRTSIGVIPPVVGSWGRRQRPRHVHHSEALPGPGARERAIAAYDGVHIGVAIWHPHEPLVRNRPEGNLTVAAVDHPEALVRPRARKRRVGAHSAQLKPKARGIHADEALLSC